MASLRARALVDPIGIEPLRIEASLPSTLRSIAASPPLGLPILLANGEHSVLIDEANIRGHPAASTVARLQQHSDTLARTWLHGERCFLLRQQHGYRPRCRTET